MTLSDAESIGSLVSGLAVLVSLVYLSLQVRQSARNQRALMQQGRANRVTDAALRMAEPTLSPIYSKGCSGDESLTADQLDQFMALCRAAFLSAEDSLLQYKSGQLDEMAYRSFATGAQSLLAAPGLRAVWRLSRDQYGDEFVRFMEEVLASAPAAPPSDRLKQWIEIVRAEKSGASARETTR
jgi:hypothetical protein